MPTPKHVELPTLVVAAVPREIRDFRSRLGTVREAVVAGWKVAYASMNGIPLVVLTTGVGPIRAAAAVSALLAHDRFSRILNVGVCGAYPDSGLGVGTLVLAESECDPQAGIETPEGFADLKGLGFPIAAGFPNALSIRNPWNDQVAAALPDARRVGIASVGICSGTDAAARRMADLSRAEVEAMEGFSIAWLAERQEIDFAELRVVSNTTGDRDRQQWDLDGACRVLDDALGRLFSVLHPIMP